MKPILRVAAMVVVATLLPLSPVTAQTTAEQERDRVRRRQSGLSQELEALQASESELLQAVEATDRSIEAASNDVKAARSAVTRAAEAAREAETELRASEAQVRELTDRLVDQAVESFVHLPPSDVSAVLRSDSVGEAARRRALLSQMEEDDDETAHELEEAQEGLRRRRDEARRASISAAARLETLEDQRASLRRLRREQNRLRRGVEARRREVAGEAQALAAEEGQLNLVIAQAQGAMGGGVGTGTGPCRFPVSGRVTSNYGARWGRLHAGMDIAATTGTPITVTMSGRVLFAGVQGGYGNVVIVDHGGGLVSLYAHQSRLDVTTGQVVAAGEQVGAVGSTGYSTGPHLHFETRRGGSAVDPRDCLG